MLDCLVATACLLAQATPPAEYRWPLDLPRDLTSSFAEYRVGRFHMGIDLRTGPIGQKVFAAADGHVSRIRCSPHGYGKAIYLQLDDGRSVVYGHLDDFKPDLLDYVRAAQHKGETYTVDLTPDPGQFPIARGEWIALSGQTGVGVPHLHYEIRDGSGAPIDPKTLGIEWPDETRPEISKVLVVPGDPESTINGDYLPVALDVRMSAEGAPITSPIAVAGIFGVGVEVVDPANNGASRLGVRSVAATLGGAEQFRVLHDRVTYDFSNDGLVAYHPFLRGEGQFLLLWRWPGNETESYARTEADGFVMAPAAATDLVVAAEDYHANAVAVSIPIQPQLPPGGDSEMERGAAPVSSAPGELHVDTFASWLVFTASFPDDEPAPPELIVETYDIQRLPFARIKPGLFRRTYAPAPGVREVSLGAAHPRLQAPIQRYAVFRRGETARRVDFDGLAVEVPAKAPYGLLLLRVDEAAARGADGLHLLGRARTLWHPSTPLDAPVRLSMPIPDGAADPARLRLYRHRGSGWSMVSGTNAGGRIEVETRDFGTYAVLEDVAPPVVTGITLKDGEALDSARPHIRAGIADTGSGIAEWRVTCNQKWLLVEYDPEEDRIEWERDEDLPAGPCEILIEVTDQAGNKTTKSRTVTVPVPETD